MEEDNSLSLRVFIHSLDSFSVNGHLKLTKLGLEFSIPTTHTSLHLGIGVPQPLNLRNRGESRAKLLLLALTLDGWTVLHKSLCV